MEIMGILKFCVVTVLISVHRSAALDSLCSHDVFENKCLCRKFTDPERNLPTSFADCNGLAIDKFPDFSQLADDLTILDLSMNSIQVLEVTGVTSSNTLKKLTLSYNAISDISEDFFKGFEALVWLDLSHNQFQTLSGAFDGNVFSHLSKLEYLDLSYNDIKELPSAIFYPLPLLQTLDLSYNPLGDFLLRSKDALNRILGVSTNITQLKLNNIGLSNDLSPDFFTLYNKLTYVELQDNSFEYIPTLPYSIEYLDFSGNNLSYISAKYLQYHSLKTLRLSRMPSLTSVHHYAFYNLLALENFILTDCPNLHELTELAFGLASKSMEIDLRRMVLARNGLTSLNSTYAHMFRNMDHIDLRHNPWKCDCNIPWLQEFEAELFRSRDMRCASPSNLRNKRIVDLSDVDMQECFPEIYGKTSHRITIVVLMAAVIFLMALIFYLIRYPKSWMTHRDMGIGPSSPYSIAYQDEPGLERS